MSNPLKSIFSDQDYSESYDDEFIIKTVKWCWPYIPIQTVLPFSFQNISCVIPVEFRLADFKRDYSNVIVFLKIMDDGKSIISETTPLDFISKFKLEGFKDLE